MNRSGRGGYGRGGSHVGDMPLTGAMTGMNPEPEGAQPASAGTTHDADLRLTTDKGVTISRMRDANRYAVFMLPPGIGAVRIVSRTTRPVSMVRPCGDDCRPRGVLVRHIKLFEGTVARHIVMHLAQKAPAGWHDDFYALRPEPCRWTDGQALLHLGPRHPGMLGVLCLEVLAGGPYEMAPAGDTTAGQARLTA
ncbi:hypothetical protein B0W47_11830 [Komagataeibacter nataicola]|uniref:Uncharacterized protein n=1 Tax=Komagataeibacter nataicola TaxID=265960 RepID=A0A9N7CS51_9PROT|nr:hypothetical protein B0W47_11830 [Komagataeibacter nataicola]PYD65060.1 hypothetical protein CDI09_15770 [Komagataeibacter nataicola]GBR14401.1 hypothetical protein AA0616_0298 [Komagataeibacter nataicola NRIC 0616]